jgi:hypothetical protein
LCWFLKNASVASGGCFRLWAAAALYRKRTVGVSKADGFNGISNGIKFNTLKISTLPKWHRSSWVVPDAFP